jgi:hypothetical protein
MIPEWLVEVDIKVCLDDFQKIAVPPFMKTKHVWDLLLWGSDR